MVRKALCVERDLAVIWDYIAADNPEAAEHCLRQIDTQFHRLAQSPFIGRERKDLAIGLRSFAIGNHVIFYQPLANGKGVEIASPSSGCRLAKRPDPPNPGSSGISRTSFRN